VLRVVLRDFHLQIKSQYFSLSWRNINLYFSISSQGKCYTASCTSAFPKRGNRTSAPSLLQRQRVLQHLLKTASPKKPNRTSALFLLLRQGVLQHLHNQKPQNPRMFLAERPQALQAFRLQICTMNITASELPSKDFCFHLAKGGLYCHLLNHNHKHHDVLCREASSITSFAP
jgi:hypothetical protein